MAARPKYTSAFISWFHQETKSKLIFFVSSHPQKITTKASHYVCFARLRVAQNRLFLSAASNMNINTPMIFPNFAS